MKNSKAWLYSLFILAVILAIATLVFLDGKYEHWGEIFRDANLPLPYVLNK